MMKLIYSIGHCECDSHTVHKLSQWCLTADWLAPLKSVHGCTVRSPLTFCQVTSRPHNRFSRYSKWPDTFQTALMCERNRKHFTITDHTEDTDSKLLSKDADNSGKLASDHHWTCYSVGKVWCTFDSMYGLNTLDWSTCCHSQQHIYSKVIFLIFTRLKTEKRKWLNVEPDIGSKLSSLKPVITSLATHHKECVSSHYFRQHFWYNRQNLLI